jgi:flagellar biosynthesis protein FliR
MHCVTSVLKVLFYSLSNFFLFFVANHVRVSCSMVDVSCTDTPFKYYIFNDSTFQIIADWWSGAYSSSLTIPLPRQSIQEEEEESFSFD